ncbi:ester cyclase [Salinispora sp. H7-4]|uniref:ester cyclase n=1 Tax=Salinispora sp. H7-4 TaxID=2748321 RepID=UPI0015D2E852|nr:ester cyclase [Salinispora sp. H7-4]NYT95294.1 ester cyclase [Salinispora sp. H7-4]
MDTPGTAEAVVAQTERSRAVARSFFAACNSHDLDRIMDFFHSDIVHHARLSDYPKEGIAFVYKMTLQAFPDLRWNVLDIIAEKDQIAALVRYEGTHRGPYLHSTDTGKRVSFLSINIARVADGRFIEHRGVLDELHLLTQIGALPEPLLTQMS